MIKRFLFLFFIGTSCLYALSQQNNYFAGLESIRPVVRDGRMIPADIVSLMLIDDYINLQCSPIKK